MYLDHLCRYMYPKCISNVSRMYLASQLLRVGMVIFVFDTHHANNILTDSPEHGDHHDTLGMHRACSKHELPTLRHDFFSSLPSMRVAFWRRWSRSGAAAEAESSRGS